MLKETKSCHVMYMSVLKAMLGILPFWEPFGFPLA